MHSVCGNKFIHCAKETSVRVAEASSTLFYNTECCRTYYFGPALFIFVCSSVSPLNTTVNTSARLSVCHHGLATHSVSDHHGFWVQRVGDTTSRGLYPAPGRHNEQKCATWALAVACWASRELPRQSSLRRATLAAEMNIV